MGVGFFLFFCEEVGIRGHTSSRKYQSTLPHGRYSCRSLLGVCGRTAGSWTVPNEIGHDGSRAKARFDAVLTLGHSW